MAATLHRGLAMHNQRIGWAHAIAAGACGAVALTVAHQLARLATEAAPRMDVVGERAVAQTVLAAGLQPPSRPNLNRLALLGDLICNSLYFSLAAIGSRSAALERGAALGLAAGVGALVLPQRMGLGDPPKSDRPANQLMTAAWYLLGGLAAGAAVRSAPARR